MLILPRVKSILDEQSKRTAVVVSQNDVFTVLRFTNATR